MKKLPNVGEVYNHYDDVRKPSRLMKSKILKITPFDDCVLTEDELEDIKSCSFLYSQNTDYVIYAILIDINKEIKYIRTLDGYWFSIGYWGGLLDVDNEFKL